MNSAARVPNTVFLLRLTLLFFVSYAALANILQEVEFIIHPDGRVEERVRGIKGMACEELTKEINKQLGEVYETKATSEMYEQKIEVNVESENTVSESLGTTSWGSDGSSGGGSSGGEW